MIDLRAALRERGADPDALPYVIRVLAENALRAYAARGSAAVSADELASIVDWRNHVGEDLPLFVSRVILPDSSGIPVLQDLAALRAGALFIDANSYEEARRRLEPLTANDRTFRHTAREFLVLASSRAGDTAATKRWFDLMMTDVQTPAATRLRVEKLMALGASPSNT